MSTRKRYGPKRVVKKMGGQGPEAVLREASRRMAEGGNGGGGETWENARGIDHAPFSPIPVPKEMPNLRLHLLRRWQPGGAFYRLGEIMDHTITPEQESRVLREAGLWWVKDDMVDLTLAAMGSIPGDVKPGELVWPAGQITGFAVFQKPWAGIDAMTGEAMSAKVHAMAWGLSRVQGETCLSFSMYNYLDFGAGMTPAEMNQAIEQGVLPEGYKERVGWADDKTFNFMLRGGAWTFMGRADWPFSEQLDSFHLEAEEHPLTPARKASLEEDRRFFAAFCTLVNHRLSSQEVVHPQRQTRRQAERAGITAPSTVRYIRLREVTKKRERDDGEEHGHVEYSHRWFSRGHMGYRWTGPLNGKRERKLTYINPSIKGPADKPLLVKTEVRTWVR